jgi:DNA-3-methyladenine glycosylase I
MKTRCQWISKEKEGSLYCNYHDKEWGTPVHDDKVLFEFLILEGAQAGLSWSTVLKKRENYRKAFDDWDFNKIAKYGEKKEKELLQNEGIIRNRLKIKSTINNAKAFIQIIKEFGSFNKYVWGFVNGKPIINKIKAMREIPATTEISDKISKNLKKRGMNFVGSTIIYAFMQAVGMVNDHEISCFRYKEIINYKGCKI